MFVCVELVNKAVDTNQLNTSFIWQEIHTVKLAFNYLSYNIPILAIDTAIWMTHLVKPKQDFL